MKKLVGVTLLALAGAVAAAVAAPSVPYEESAFKKAQNAGQAVLVEFYRQGSPHCQMLEAAVNRVARERSFRTYVRLRADLDRDKDLVRMFGARQEGTLVLFRYGDEFGRLEGETGDAAVRALLKKGLRYESNGG
jgi:thioredoxin-like negative regulator of GroEL